MIFENIFIFLFDLLRFFIDSLFLSLGVPGIVLSVPDWAAQFFNLLLKGLAFFPFDVWSILISNIMLWVGIHFVWSVIEWLYIKYGGKKLEDVDESVFSRSFKTLFNTQFMLFYKLKEVLIIKLYI